MSGTIHDKIADSVAGFGGVLRCERCGDERPLGDTAEHFRTGWPVCCEQTMTWVTARQLAAEVLDD